MRAAFLFAILLASAFYTAIAFTQLNFLSALGRIAPGFFPRIIGVALTALCLYGLYDEWRRRPPEDPLSPHWRVVLAMVALSGLFVLALSIVGGVIAMALFLLASLSLLDRGHPVRNVLLSLVLPAAVYVLFRVWLNAAMPDGLLPLPL